VALTASVLYFILQEIQAYSVELARKKITEYPTVEKPCSTASGKK